MRYTVQVQLTGTIELEVEAANESDAEQTALGLDLDLIELSDLNEVVLDIQTCSPIVEGK